MLGLVMGFGAGVPISGALLWLVVAAASGLAAAAGYGFLDGAAPGTVGFVFAVAGGTIVAMLSTSLIPEGYELAGRLVGLFVTFFAVAFAVSFAEA